MGSGDPAAARSSPSCLDPSGVSPQRTPMRWPDTGYDVGEYGPIDPEPGRVAVGGYQHPTAAPAGKDTVERTNSGEASGETHPRPGRTRAGAAERELVRSNANSGRVVAAFYGLANRHQRRTFVEGWRELAPDRPVPLELLEHTFWGRVQAWMPPCLDFAHLGRWHRLVERTKAAWCRWANPASNIHRCGLDISIFECPACGKEHAIEKTCRSRYCPECIGDVRARTQERVGELVDKHFEHTPRFLTLTKRNVATLLGSTREFLKAFGRMRRLTRVFRARGRVPPGGNPEGFYGRWFTWPDLVRGGIYACEITEDLGRRDELVWHPHLHILLDAKAFLPWQWIVEAWQRANGCKCPRSKDRTVPVLCKHSTWVETKGRYDSWEQHAHDLANDRAIKKGSTAEAEYSKVHAGNKCKGCDVEPGSQNIEGTTDPARAVRELVKYVGKSLKTSKGMMAFQPALQEFLEETWGKRMLSAFGELHGAEEKEEPESRTCEDCGTPLEFVTTITETAWSARAPPDTKGASA